MNTPADDRQIRAIPTPYGKVYARAGIRGYADRRYELLAETIEAEGRVLDLNPGIGLVALRVAGGGLEVTLVESSRANLLALERTRKDQPRWRLVTGLPWDVEAGAFSTAALVLPAERGSRFVQAALASAGRALVAGGRLWIAGEKKKGFEQYFKWAKRELGYGLVVRREGPLRIAVLEKEREPDLPPLWHRFEARLRDQNFVFHTLPGVFSEHRVDPASLLLLESLPELTPGTRVLDLGAGYGALTLPLAAKGAQVLGLEDDLAAVRSARRSLKANALQAEIYHSDVDEALKNAGEFDIVVTNPPFHVGGSVILDVARAFIEAAYRHTRKGGRFYLVANPFLKYEALMDAVFGNHRVLRVARYKVLVSER